MITISLRTPDVRRRADVRSAHAYYSGCYAVDGVGGDHVNLVGPVLLQGTLGH